MSELDTMHDRLKEQAAMLAQIVASHSALLEAVGAEIARVPTLADVQALLARAALGK